MGRSPIIGRSSVIEEMKQEAVRNLEDLKPTDEERARGSYEAIVAAREVERSQMVATLTQKQPETPAVVAIQTKEPVASIIGRFTARTAEVTAAAAADRTAEARKLEAGQVAEAKSLETRHGILKKKYQERVEGAFGTDFAALLASLPEGLQHDPDRQGLVAVNHLAVYAYKAAAEHARELLRSSFGDRVQGNDPDPVNLSGAAQQVENAIIGGQTHDALTGLVAPVFLRAISHLTWWVEKGRNFVDATERAVKAFDQAESKLKKILATVEPTDGPPSEKVSYLPPIERTREMGSTSYVDFDPREHTVKQKKSDVEIVPLGQGDGFRVTGGDR
jgi:hypothetical protein